MLNLHHAGVMIMENIIINLGILLFAAAAVSFIFMYFKQSTMLAYIITGLSIAIFFHNSVLIPDEIIDLFTKIGIILLMFMAGLGLNYKNFIKRWKLILINSLGLTIINTGIGIVIGLIFLDLTQLTAIIYFGLIMTFSSTTIVINYLKTRRESESFHGQLLVGMMALQDVFVVIAIAVLNSVTTGGSFLPDMGFLIIKIVGMAVLLIAFSKFIFKPFFRQVAKSAEILFISSLGLVMGVAALAEFINFSSIIAVFMLGASLSNLPYKLEIEDKIESIKNFGLVIFFILLGYKLNLSNISSSALLPILIIVLFNFVGIPLIMLFLGYITKQKSRPVFMIGGIINHISEFALIIATLCYNTGIFKQETFFIIIISGVISIFLSSLGHNFLSGIYSVLQEKIYSLDKHSKLDISPQISIDFELENHIILISYNELSKRILTHFANTDQKIILLDLDPEVIIEFEDKYTNVKCLYLDIFDPDTRDIAVFNKAKLIISCLIQGQPAELGVLNWLKDKKANVPFLAVTDSQIDALELYQAGAAYVIQTKGLAAEHLDKLIQDTNNDYKKFFDYGTLHKKTL